MCTLPNYTPDVWTACCITAKAHVSWQRLRSTHTSSTTTKGWQGLIRSTTSTETHGEHQNHVHTLATQCDVTEPIIYIQLYITSSAVYIKAYPQTDMYADLVVYMAESEATNVNANELGSNGSQARSDEEPKSALGYRAMLITQLDAQSLHWMTHLQSCSTHQGRASDPVLQSVMHTREQY